METRDIEIAAESASSAANPMKINVFAAKTPNFAANTQNDVSTKFGEFIVIAFVAFPKSRTVLN